MKLFFRKYGSGPPLIILHGLFGASDNWVTIAKNISERFTVYLPDLRNHGNSPHSPVHDYDSMSDDLYEMISDLNLDRFFLAGHSMGGKVAMNFAMKWPEKISGLIIADISPIASEKRYNESLSQHAEILKTILSTDPAHFNSRNEAESFISATISSEKIRALIMKNLRRNPDDSFTWKINASSLLENLDKIMEGIDPDKVHDVPITGFPVFFLKGEYSDYLPEKDFDAILKIFPSAEFIKIPEASHWIQSDNPEAVKKAVLKLLA